MNLGINLVEVNGKAAQTIQSASTSVAAFVVRSSRGVPGRVRQVTSYAEFLEYFGGPTDDAYGAFAVRGFFDNGGALAYVIRALRVNEKHELISTAANLTIKVGPDDNKVNLEIRAAYRNEEDPGTWGEKLSIAIEGNADQTFNLVVEEEKGRSVERWERLTFVNPTKQQDPRRINDELSGSKYIRLVIPPGMETNPPETVAPLPLTGGNDDIPAQNLAPAEATAANKSLLAALQAPILNGAFDALDIQLLAVPESLPRPELKTLTTAGLTYCEGRGDCMFLGHTSEDESDTAEAAKDFGAGLQGDKVYGALYFPFIRVADPRGGTRWVPPTGHVMGVYARTERERGIWKAPAGNAANLAGALETRVTLSDTQHTVLVKKGSVNAIRFVPGKGIVVDSSRTLSTNPLWLYVNVRLLFNFVKSSLKSGLRWVVQEPNDDTLWKKVKYNTVIPFLMGLWRRGAFGTGTPEQVFTVICDASNNPSTNVNVGIFNLEVYFYPSRPAETVIITVGQQDSGASAGEH